MRTSSPLFVRCSRFLCGRGLWAGVGGAHDQFRHQELRTRRERRGRGQLLGGGGDWSRWPAKPRVGANNSKVQEFKELELV